MMIFPARRAWMPGERAATGISQGRMARKNRENEDHAPESEKLGLFLLLQNRHFRHPWRSGINARRQGDKFPCEALGVADANLVYRKQISLKLWDSSAAWLRFLCVMPCNRSNSETGQRRRQQIPYFFHPTLQHSTDLRHGNFAVGLTRRRVHHQTQTGIR